MRLPFVALAALVASPAPAETIDPLAWPELPADHAAHPGEPYEEWVFTGHVEREQGGWLAYHVAFHRVDVDTALAPDAERPWMFRSIYPVSAAVTDLTSGRFLHVTRVDRDGAGTTRYATGAPDLRARAWHAWTEGDVWRLHAPGESFSLSLTLVPVKPPVAIGADGVLTTGEGGPGARRYALPRLETTGTVSVGGDTVRVSGVSWLDHTYGHTLATPGEAGWDLANIKLRDGAELALYRFRSQPGRRERRIGGAYVSASGVVMRLETLTTRFYPVGSNRWASPRTSQSYPVRWRVEIPALSIRLDVACVPADQELASARTHGAGIWRGSIEATGSRGDAQITGAGFMEMVGYAGAFPPAVAEAAW